ncbi:MAG TPA: ABC transporter ATP-binding protein [Candidatus Thermoplasmatota archaeon]|jgi:energy-coupling factor transport system ATP-binding protein|nr:ABC transporter ATP-binding protein [Candidatus Thermoplasmatota archaeon]
MIEARSLSLRLGDRWVLRGASLAVARGEVGVLTGPSGSGKSALLKLLLGLRPRAASLAVEGDARLLGLDALRTPTPMLARRAGLLLQDVEHQLTQPDVAAELAFRAENLGLPWRDVEGRVEDAARRFGLAGLLERPVHSLSGGEAKRAALASIRAAAPEALLLDEPLGGLDAAGRALVLADLRREARGRATLVVEHRAAPLAKLARRAWVIRDGAAWPCALRAAPLPRRPRARAAASPRPLVLAEGLRAGVLDDVSFEASAGVTLVRGDNGAGKTSLLRALAGLAAHEGTLRVAGLDPRADLRRTARVIAYVPQRPEAMFVAASARAEIAYGLAGPVPRGLADALGLAHLLDRHPLTLSGGEQQRLALACALARRPRVVLLDEPTVGLDAPGLARVLGALGSASAGTSIVVASHDPELAALADRVVVLERGRVAYEGPPRRAVEVAA